ncbi:aminoglycoside adenylyltransferase domain-containing protein [Pseudalkalibacillus decolorationis]|uniref:aminoglycoside adenylyltransferase domain-containing protein n=1 Tax=Pseudalkalibacillus decolorationis TaxID=163879 RepID=UPI002147CC5C|nr:aminoglycoside adenylyltransferase domain-containing protein [Pseudalkalibacillus decolorationis]
MGFDWGSCPLSIRSFVNDIVKDLEGMLAEDMVGVYLHGSLAIGGFNPKSSDIDLLAVTSSPLSKDSKHQLAQHFLEISKHPYPIEISILSIDQLRNWNHPSPFEFHYSEFWRDCLESDFEVVNDQLNSQDKKDPDLAAHLTITRERGICLHGKPIKEVLPSVPRADYIDSIMEDYQDCLESIEQKPIYSILNILRVYWFVKEGVISSKEETGTWGLNYLPKEFHRTIRKALEGYRSEKLAEDFNRKELLLFRDYFVHNDNFKKKVLP